MIKHLKGLEINTIYDFDNAFSINELLCKFWEKIEETINISNESIDILNWVKEQGLPDEVERLITQLVEDGTIEQMININKIEELKTVLNTHKEEITNLKTLINTNKEEITNKITGVNEQIEEITIINGKKIYQFSNVESMKAYKLKVNEVCETLGYYSTNDGGGCRYLVETQSKGLGSVLLKNGLYANIVFDNNNRVNVLTLGVKRNVEEDQSTLVNTILNSPTKKIFYFPYGYYYFTNKINQNKRHDIIGDDVTTGDFDKDINGTRFIFMGVADNSILLDCYSASRCTIKNIYIISNAVSILEDRPKHSINGNPVDMFTVNKTRNNITGLSIGLFGNTIENVAVQGCNIGISGGTYNTFNNVSFLECETGLQVLNDNQIHLIRAIRCRKGINIKGGLNILTNIRFDSIQEYGIIIDYAANYNNITGLVADWCQYGAVMINSNYNYINGFIGRCGTYYANAPIGTANEPEKACLVYLKNCSYNRLDIINNFESVGDNTSDNVKTPSFQIVLGQGGTNEYNNITLTGNYGFTGLANELDIDKLNHLVCLNGSYGNTLLNVYGRQYHIKSGTGKYEKSNIRVSSLGQLV